MQTLAMQTQFLDLYRAGLRNAADMMSATLESTRRLQQQQLEAMHTAMDDQARSMRELSEVRTMEELMSLQLRLAGMQAERTMQLLGGVWRAAAQNPLGQPVRDLSVSTSTSIANALREASQVNPPSHHDQRAA